MDTKQLLNYFTDLSQNNNREWFQANKPIFDKLRKEFETYINELIPEIRKFDNSIGLITAKECVFRIYRDVRFSKDKTPYKTHFGAFIANGGRKSYQPGYYLHLADGESMIAGGVHMPPPETLKAIRNEIYYNSDDLKKILNNKTFARYFPGLSDWDKLKRPPKGFPADFADVDLLKHKSFTVAHTVKNSVVEGDDFFKYILKVFKVMHPLNAYLDEAMKD